MDVLVTGVYGRCGTAIIDRLHDRDDYDFTYYNRSDRSADHPYGGYDTVVGDISEYEKLRDACEGQDAVVHLAAYHPYGDAEQGVEDGKWERGSDRYDEEVARMKATRQSRRDFAHQVDCCLQDESVEFDVFSGVSDNRRRWFDLEHARATIGYDPQDDGETWDAPPE